MDYIKAFEEYLIEQDRSKHTVSCYIRDLKQLEGWSSISLQLGVGELAQINLTHFRRFLKSQYDSFTTINRKIAAINTFYKWLHENGYIENIIGVKNFNDRSVRDYRGLSEQELWKIRTEVHRSGDKMHICIFEVLLNTGIRVSELTSIRLHDFQISQRKGSLTVIGKGEVKRIVPLNKDARKAITEYLKVRRNVGDYLFIGQRGQLGRNAINLILKKYGRRVGVKISCHKLRHTLGYMLVKKRTAVTTIQQIFGHNSLQTSNRYIVTMEKDMEDALDEVEW